MDKRPKCDYCKKSESAFCRLAMKWCCANCLMKFERAKNKTVHDMINSIKD